MRILINASPIVQFFESISGFFVVALHQDQDNKSGFKKSEKPFPVRRLMPVSIAVYSVTVLLHLLILLIADITDRSANKVCQCDANR